MIFTVPSQSELEFVLVNSLFHLVIQLIAEDKRMYSRVSKSVSLAIALAFVALLPVAIAAQNSSKPAAKADASDSPSRWDIFAGYSYMAPKGNVYVGQPNGDSLAYTFKAEKVGSVESLAYYFTKYIGVQVESGQHDRYYNTDTTANRSNGSSNSGILSFQTGLIARYPVGNLTLFAHGLVGAADVEGPYHQGYKWGPTFLGGGGWDYNTPWFNHRLAIRIFQADAEYIHANYGPSHYSGESWVNGGRVNVVAPVLSTGLVYHIGSIAPPPTITLACSATPTSVFPGDPIALSATAGDIEPKANVVYSWSGAGVTGSGTTGSVATGSLAPGNYTVNCGVKEGKAGKEGLKPWQSASATATFTVKAFEPPTVSCSANPTTIKPGETATVTAMGMSPQNRPLTYAYSAAAGTITGTGSTAVFSSTGAPTGTTAITCTVSDDKGQTANANTGVTITAPYVAPIPHTQALCSITFSNDKKRPSRVDNEAKACLDEVALDLQRQSDAKAVVVGDATANEKNPPVKRHAKKAKKVEDLAAERAVNTKEYLVTEKGIDASRINVATGTTDGQKVEDYLVPSGATFANDVAGTTPVDETVVKPQVRKALPERHAARKHAAKTAK